MGVVGSAMLGAVGCSARRAVGPAAARQAAAPQAAAPTGFRSRPDLSPPVITVRGRAPDVTQYVFITPNGTSGQGGSMIADSRGRPVWFRPWSGTTAANLRVQQYQGSPVLTWWEGTVSSAGVGHGEYVLLDGAYRELRRVKAGHGYQGDLHEFLITPAGTALLTAYQPVPADLSALGGPSQGVILDSIVQEVDVASGNVVFEWHSRDHVALDESHASASTLSAAQPFDYFHVNSIDVDADGNLLVSARNTWAVYKLNRQTGAVIWRLGGKRSDFAMGAGTQFAWQHDARRHADGTITLFDDGAAPQVEAQSRGIVLVLDEAAMTAKLVKQQTHPGGLLAGSQGNLQLLPDGDVFIGWGAQHFFSEFDKSGRLVFDGSLPAGVTSYRSFRFPWAGLPAERPSLVTAPASGDARTLYASWNGATDVTRWQVLAGIDPDRLRPIGSTTKAGFETAIAVRTSQPYVAVRAVDRSGRELATSPAVKL